MNGKTCNGANGHHSYAYNTVSGAGADGGAQRRYALKVLLGEKSDLAAAQEGGRNNRACAAARRLGNLIGADLLSFDESENALVEACQSNGLWRDDPRGTQTTIRTNLKEGMRKPDFLDRAGNGEAKSNRRQVRNRQQEAKTQQQVWEERRAARRKEEALARGRKWHREGQPLAGTLGGRYIIETRGLTCPEANEAVFHPAAYGKDTGGRRPAILFPVMTAPHVGETIGYLRVFLEREKPEKADIASPKQILGSQEGGAIWFGDWTCETLVIAEGAENARVPIAAGYRFTAAAISSGNMPKVPIPDHVTEIIIAADWGSDGEKFAKRAAAKYRSMERAVRIVRPPKAKTAKGKWQDWNDLLVGSSVAAVRAALDGAQEWRSDVSDEDEADWTELLSYESAQTASTFPLLAVPPAIWTAAEEVTAYVKCPVEVAISSAIAVISLVVQGLVNVKRDSKLTGPVSIYMMVLADSGERKTTVDNFFMRGPRQYEAEQQEKAEPELKAYRARLSAWKAEREGYEGAIRQAAKDGSSLTELKERLEEHELNEPAEPRVPGLVRGDDTREQLAWALAKQWPSAGHIHSEAGSFLGGHAMSSDKVMATFADLNTYWDGTDKKFDRRTVESFTVRNARLTVALQLQEPTLRAFCLTRGELARGIGFFARYLLVSPKSTQGTRTYSEPPEHWPAISAFERRIIALLEATKLDEKGTLQLDTITFDREGHKEWVALYNAIELQLAEGKDYYDVRDVASKAADNIARVAALFHVFEHGPAGHIGAATVRAAGEIVLWYLSESKRFFCDFAKPAEFVAARQLEEWLLGYLDRQGWNTVPLSSVQQLVTPKYLRQRKVLDEAVQTLIDLGRARIVAEGKRKLIEVRPTLRGAQ
jgi:putative DNA primase/helicase